MSDKYTDSSPTAKDWNGDTSKKRTKRSPKPKKERSGSKHAAGKMSISYVRLRNGIKGLTTTFHNGKGCSIDFDVKLMHYVISFDTGDRVYLPVGSIEYAKFVNA